MKDPTMNTILYFNGYRLKLEMMCMLYVYMVIATVSSIAKDNGTTDDRGVPLPLK